MLEERIQQLAAKWRAEADGIFRSLRHERNEVAHQSGSIEAATLRACAALLERELKATAAPPPPAPDEFLEMEYELRTDIGDIPGAD